MSQQLSDRLKATLRDADLSRKSEKFQKAVSLYQEAIEMLNKIQRHDYTAEEIQKMHLYKSTCLISLQKYKEAEQSLNYILKLNPKSVKAYFLKGNCSFKKQKWDDCILEYSQAIELQQLQNCPQTSQHNSSIDTFYYNRCLSYEKKNNLERSVKDLKQAIANSPNNHIYYFQMGRLLRSMNQLSESVAALQKCTILNPCSESGSALLIAVYKQMNRYEDAVKTIDSLIQHYRKGSFRRTQQQQKEIKENEVNQMHQQIALLSDKIFLLRILHRDSDEILSVFDEVIAISREMRKLHTKKENKGFFKQSDTHSWNCCSAAKFLNNKGVYLDLLGDRGKEALSCYELAIVEDANFCESHINKGNLLMRRKQYFSAKRQFDLAIQKKSMQMQSLSKSASVLDPIYYCHRSLTHVYLQSTPEAIQDVKMAKQIIQSKKTSGAPDSRVKLTSNDKFIEKTIQVLQKFLEKIGEIELELEKHEHCKKVQLSSHSSQSNNIGSTLLRISHNFQTNRIQKTKSKVLQSIILSMTNKYGQREKFDSVVMELQEKVKDLRSEILHLHSKNLTIESTVRNLNKTNSQYLTLKHTYSEQENKIQKLSDKMEQMQKFQEKVLKDYHGDFEKMESYDKILRQKIIQYRKSSDSELSPKIAEYAQSMFWMLNGYFLSFRILKTKTVKKNEAAWESQIASILNEVKKVLTLFTGVPVVKQGIEIVCQIAGLYLEGEKDLFNEKMYQFIAQTFTNQEQINESICKAIILLLEQNFIEKRISKKYSTIGDNAESEREDIISLKTVKLEEAKKWLETKRVALLSQLSGINSQSIIQDYHLEIEKLVIEDLADIFAFMALNSLKQINSPSLVSQGSETESPTENVEPGKSIEISSGSDILCFVVEKALIKKQLNDHLIKVYSRTSNANNERKSISSVEKQECCKCEVF